jgi:hypothetical protein
VPVHIPGMVRSILSLLGFLMSVLLRETPLTSVAES